jgi:hypothetical protein
MVNSTKVFTFNSIASTSFTPSIINATLNNDMYEFAPLGAKSIREEKIQGRDLPYFYNVEYEPMSFTMTIAFENYATQAEVNEVIKWLYLPKKPALLSFTEYQLNYFGLFIGQPNFYYVGNNIDGYKFIGYIEVEFRANAPYGWTNPIYDTTNTGDLEILPSFTITNGVGIQDNTVTITNTTNSTSFVYTLDANEVLTFNGYTKILSSNIDPNPYKWWTNKDYLVFNPGSNTVTITASQGEGTATVAYQYRAPKIL